MSCNFKGVSLSAIQDDIRPLDLILLKNKFKQNPPFFLGKSYWTDICLVITSDICPIKNGRQGILYVWNGEKIQKLSDIVGNNDYSHIAYCRLKDNPIISQPYESASQYEIRREIIRRKLSDFKQRKTVYAIYKRLDIISSNAVVIPEDIFILPPTTIVKNIV